MLCTSSIATNRKVLWRIGSVFEKCSLEIKVPRAALRFDSAFLMSCWTSFAMYMVGCSNGSGLQIQWPGPCRAL